MLKLLLMKEIIVCDWRNPIGNKFSKLPGIRSLHDFIFVTKGDRVEAKIRKLCHIGSSPTAAALRCLRLSG